MKNKWNSCWLFFFNNCPLKLKLKCPFFILRLTSLGCCLCSHSKATSCHRYKRQSQPVTKEFPVRWFMFFPSMRWEKLTSLLVSDWDFRSNFPIFFWWLPDSLVRCFWSHGTPPPNKKHVGVTWAPGPRVWDSCHWLSYVQNGKQVHITWLMVMRPPNLNRNHISLFSITTYVSYGKVLLG